MKIIASMSHEELAAFVCQALTDAGIKVVLSGGACVAIWSNGQYESQDIDFIEQGFSSRKDIRNALAELGFTERQRYFEHPDTDLLIEFPSGPPAVGDEPVKDVAERRNSTGVLRLLSPTDCVKDRLAAFFHWDDQQALEQAVMVARAQTVNMNAIRRWARNEQASEQLKAFETALGKN